MKLKTLSNSKIKKGMRILMRVDVDVPLKNGKVVGQEVWRLERAIPDIENYIKRGAVVILVGHLGRPNGKIVKKLSLEPVSDWLANVRKIKNSFSREITGDKVQDLIDKAKNGSVIFLENVRFSDREEKDCKKFAKKLAVLADVYVNNAFGTCHRKHSSIHAITQYLPSYAGSVLVDEVSQLSKKRKKPVVLVIGGAKLKTKISLIKKLAVEANAVIIGGGLALVFHSVATGIKLKIGGKEINKQDATSAKQLLKRFDNLFFPIDYINQNGENIHASDVTATTSIIDIGKTARKQFARFIEGSNTIIFNGTLGIVEDKNGFGGTLSVAKTILKNKTARLIVGGGDTVSFLQNKKLIKGFAFVSTGGGSMLKFLVGEKLPGLEVLKK